MEGSAFSTGGSALLNQGVAVAALAALVLLLLGVIWHHARKINQLEQKLVSQHRFLRQELKMMSQGAIGVGNRVKHLEKQVKQQPTPFEQLLMQQAEQPPTPSRRPEVAEKKPEVAASPREKSRAEQALSDWMRDYQTTA